VCGKIIHENPSPGAGANEDQTALWLKDDHDGESVDIFGFDTWQVPLKTA
jgi:hypothetical protein